ncbi:MAG TPA: DUF2846 domain-containing protein [Chthoniobacterales bacterium]|nr:DUF2846 domain-containing protein [Chthoniobacterales bacterium]
MKIPSLIYVRPTKFAPRLLILAIAGCLLSSCASVQREAAPAQPDRPEPGKGLVIVYRERHFTGGGVSYKVLDNGTRIGGLPNGAYFVYQAKPGVHTFTAATEATDEKPLTVEAGKTYYIRGEVQMGFFVGRPHLIIVDRQEAVGAIKELHRVKMKP